MAVVAALRYVAAGIRHKGWKPAIEVAGILVGCIHLVAVAGILKVRTLIVLLKIDTQCLGVEQVPRHRQAHRDFQALLELALLLVALVRMLVRRAVHAEQHL